MALPTDLELSVCIATYRRPVPLARLLTSLTCQTGALPSFEILIVDNDAAGGARATCKEFEDRLPIRYEVERERGLSPARNRCVSASRGRLLAFVDDDCVVSPDWVSAIYAAAIRSAADSVIAPVYRQTEGEPPELTQRRRTRDRPPWAADAPIPWYATHTTNACLRRSALPSAAPFDPALALIGGEDLDLFARMIEAGARVVAIEAPIVEERRQAARASFAWLIRRSFRTGGSLAHVEWRDSSGAQLALHSLHAFSQAAISLMLVPFALAESRSAAFARLRHSVTALGMTAWAVGIVYSEYRRPD